MEQKADDVREIETKRAWIQLMCAHFPLLAENQDQSRIMHAQLREFREIFESFDENQDSEENHEALRVRHAHFLDTELRTATLTALNRLRIIYQVARKSFDALENECKVVLMERVQKGETEGLDPETVAEVHEAVAHRVRQSAFRALFEGANVIDLDALLAKGEQPMAKAPPITS